MIGQQAAGSLGWSLLGQVADGGDLPADAAGRLVALLLLVVLLLVVLFTAFFLVRSLQRPAAAAPQEDAAHRIFRRLVQAPVAIRV